MLLLAGPANAGICESAIHQAEQDFRIPAGLLMAVGAIEAGRPDGSVSPWALNVDGRSVYPTDQNNMLAELDSALRAGATNVDVGCVQISLKYHHKALPDWHALLDPRTGTRYGAWLLRHEFEQRGSWSAAVGAYHSPTPVAARDYACSVGRRYAKGRGYVPPAGTC
jgi:hypothetical protein